MSGDGRREVTGDDREVVAGLLGRAPQGAFEVVVRDASGTPVVILNAPLLDDGTPMPTRYWLVGRRELKRVGRLESQGGVKHAEAAFDPGELAAAHRRYELERDRALPAGHVGPRPTGGVGGTRQGVKCLHAHLAWHLAGGDDPVGRWTAAELGIDRDEYARRPAADTGNGAERATRPAEASHAVAAIDCGTNSTRLLVVDPNGNTVVRLMRITRLGEGVDHTGRLGEGAMQRTIDVLTEYRAAMDAHGVVKARATATSAARDAANVAEFAARVTDALGFGLEVLDGEEEGRFAFRGATAGLDASAGPHLLIDVGGGSTELVAGPEPALVVVSLDIGCVRATERYLAHDPPTAAELGAARAHVHTLVTDAARTQPALQGAAQAVGVAGTVAALTGLDQGLLHYDRDRIHHRRLSAVAIEWLLGELAILPVAERRLRPGLEPERADVIVGGAAVLAEVMATLDFDELIASESDLLDGLAEDLLAS